MKNLSYLIFLAVLAITSVQVITEQTAFADSEFDKVESSDETGPIVRRKLLYRSTRFELVPQVGFTINDAFRRNILVGATAAYHLTNEFGIAASGGFGLLHLNSDLADNVEATLGDSDLEAISYSEIQWAADIGVYYVPIFGKFSALQSSSLNFDVHIGGGFSLVNEVGSPAIEGGIVDPTLEGIRPGGFASLGFRMFLSDGISINAEWKNLFYNRTLVSRANAKSELSYQPMITAGIGIFFPGSVKVSR